MTATIARLVCRIRGHEWRNLYGNPRGVIYARRKTEGRGFTYWDQRVGGRQLPIIDGRGCKRCGLTIWEDQ